MNKKQNYALPIAVMFALFAMISFVTGFQNPMGVIVKSQFGASNFLSQLGTFANFIAYAFMGIPAGIMLKRLGYKKTALAAVTVGFVGVGITVLSGTFQSFGIYLAGAFVSGFSMCMLNTVVNPMLNTLGGGGKRGNQLLQFGGAFNSISATIVPVLVGYLMGAEAGRTIEKANPVLFLAMGIFAVAFLVLALVRIPEPHIEKKSASKVKDKYSPLSFRHFILGAVAIFIYVGVEVGIPNIANIFMTTSEAKGGLGIDATVAGTIVGTYWFLMFVGRLLGGLVGGKVSSRSMLAAMSGIALVLVAVAMFSPSSAKVRMPVLRSGPAPTEVVAQAQATAPVVSVDEGTAAAAELLAQVEPNPSADQPQATIEPENGRHGLSFGMELVPLSIMLLTLCGLCTSIMWGSIFNLAVQGLGKYTAAASGIFMVMVCGGGILPAIQGWVADLGGYLTSYWVVVAGIVYLIFYAFTGSRNVNKGIPTE